MKKLLAAALALSCAAASAAPQPTSGTFNGQDAALAFSGGPFLAPNPTSDRVYLGDSTGRSTLVCNAQAMNCDQFLLSVDLPASVRDRAEQKKQALRIDVTIQERQPLPLIQPQFDVYVLDANGNELAKSDTQGLRGGLDAQLDLPLRAVTNGRYVVVVTGRNSLGASYAATVGLAPPQ